MKFLLLLTLIFVISAAYAQFPPPIDPGRRVASPPIQLQRRAGSPFLEPRSSFNLEDDPDSLEQPDVVEPPQEDDPGDLFITLSSVNKFQIEINWNLTSMCDEIRLYLQQPPLNKNIAPQVRIQPLELSGYFVTRETFSLNDLPHAWKKGATGFNIPNGPITLNYCLATVQNNQIKKTTCLKIQPTWMKNNEKHIGNVPLTELMIPGTHNAGCYADNPHWDIKNPLYKFLYTQDVDIWTQLVFGIRYLDVRVGYFNTTSLRAKFWVSHDKFIMNPLIDLFRDVKKFLAKAKDEIVILDLHRFPVGFESSDRHKQLVAFIDSELGDIAISRKYQMPPLGPTLNTLWEQDRRLIICYGDAATALNSNYLWDPLTQKWGDKQNLNDLKHYLEAIRYNHETKNSNKLWASMAELTPTPAIILESLLNLKNGSLKSLAHMADLVNRNLNVWYRYNQCNANIIATDYFLGNDLINIALECNRRNEL